MNLVFECEICDGSGWEGLCDCDPGLQTRCNGQGSCGMHECPSCKGEGTLKVSATGESLARVFHESYEALAPDYGYKTREASAVPWAAVPDKNKRLMVATATRVLSLLEDMP